MTSSARAAFVIGLFALPTLGIEADANWISIFPSGHEAILREEGASVWTRQAEFIVGTAPDRAIERLSGRGITPSSSRY